MKERKAGGKLRKSLPKISEEHAGGLSLLEAEAFAEAAERLERAAGELEPGWLAKSDYALALSMVGRAGEALSLLDSLLAKDPENSFLLLNRFYVEEAEKVRSAGPPSPLSRVLEVRGRGPEDPKVTVVMPTFNRPDLIRESVMSVFAQTFPRWELIIVNDGGDRAVEKTIAGFLEDSRVRYVLAEHGGLSSARNIGLALAKGEFLTQLDDDDIYYPHHLETLLSALEKNPGYLVAYSDFFRAFQEKRGGEWITVRKVLDRAENMDRNAFRTRTIAPGDNVIIHRRVLEVAGFYNEHILRAMDWEFFIRVSRRFDFLHVREATGEFRQKEDRSQMSRSFTIPRNFYRNLISYLHGFFPLTGRLFLKSPRNALRLKKELDRLLASDQEDFFMKRLELRKLLSEPGYALFYTLGKRVLEEGRPELARLAFRAAFRMSPWEPKLWAWWVRAPGS